MSLSRAAPDANINATQTAIDEVLFECKPIMRAANPCGSPSPAWGTGGAGVACRMVEAAARRRRRGTRVLPNSDVSMKSSTCRMPVHVVSANHLRSCGAVASVALARRPRCCTHESRRLAATRGVAYATRGVEIVARLTTLAQLCPVPCPVRLAPLGNRRSDRPTLTARKHASRRCQESAVLGLRCLPSI